VTLYSFAIPRPLRRRPPSQTNAELRDLDFIELHDSFTISELNPYDVLGITARGDGKRALDEGWVYAEGPRPVNPSGGGGLAVAYFATPASSPMTVLEAC
jgi:acetyl-CoA C-acetyltransferase